MENVRSKTATRAASVQLAAAPVAVQSKAAAATVAAPVLQASSLRVSSPRDPAEREADSTAAKVMRMAMPEGAIGLVASAGGSVFRQVQRKLASPYIARFASSGFLQRKNEGQVDVGANVQAELQNSTSGGSPLPLSVRRFMEPRFRADFSRVKVHTGDRAASLSQQLSARAFTIGGNVFFGRGQFRPESREGKELIAHELTHTIQQGQVAQRSPEIQRSEDVTVTQQAPAQVQRDSFDSILGVLADNANNIPGFRMFTIVLGVNPITMSGVDRSAANILRAVVEFMPGGALITQALDKYGVFDKAGAWVEQQLSGLGMTGASIKQSVTDFLKTLGPMDVFSPGSVWARAKSILAEPVERIKSFLKGIATAVVQFVKDAILKPLANLASQSAGWDLLKAVLGRDPITGDPVPRTAETLIGGFMKLIGQEEVWDNIKKGKAIDRAWAWFQSALSSLMGFVEQLPGLFIAALKSLVIEDLILLPQAFLKVGKVFADFAIKFTTWATNAVWDLLEIVFSVVAPGVMVYLNKARSAFKTILKNPMAFANNLVSAAKLGFSQFGSNFVKHLKAALIGWLTGALAGAGVYIPQGLTLLEIGKFVLSVLGITWPKIRAKIAKVIGDTAMNALETGFELVKTLVTGGPAAAWELIKEKLANLRDTVMQAIISFVTQKVVEAAITKLLSMLSPVGAFIQAIIGIYNSVMFFVERLKQIAAVVAAFIDSISAIASGVIAAAANRVESTLGGLLTLVISFLARFAGLGKISGYISEKIQALQARVDTAIDSAVAWIVTKAKAFLATLMGKGKDKKPDERTEAEKTRDKKAAIGEAEKLLTKDFDEEAVIAKLGPIKSRYKLLTLDLVVDTKNDTSETVHFTASASAVEVGQPKPIQLVRRLELVRLQKAFIAREKDGDGKKLPMTVDELKRQVAIQQAAMRQLSVKEYRANWQKFYPVGGKKGGRSDSTEAAQQRAFQVSLERGKAMDRWHIHNPGKIAEGRAFVDELFKPRPGDKSYPFMHKSLPDANGVEYVNGAYGMAILHALDQGAGGGSETAGLGGARENSSIGAQWDRGGRAKSLNLDLEAAIGRRQEKSEKVDKMKLFVELPVEVR